MEIRVLESQNEIYQKQKLLGEGAFGKAYLVRQKHTGELLVIKEVNIDHMSQKEREQTIKEAQILRNFRHPLIVKFIEVYATKQNKLKIVMEYAECGDLSKAITTRRNQKKTFEESQILDWFTQICLAMKHVHDRKILHRDIKGQNIFITKANTLKLGDFGIARVLNKTQDKARTVVGTPYYLSPQIIENKPYSFKSDIWSMGVLLYELCALSPPFTATSLQFLALKIVKGSYSRLAGNYSKQLKGLIEEMLQLDPNRRPSVGDILKKPFLQDRIRKYLSETYHKQQFSHTILHNQKVEISNKLVKVQEEKNIEKERNRLKQEALMLKEKMEKKKQEDRFKEEERLRKRQEQEIKKRQEMQRRKEQMQKQRQLEQMRAIQERKHWIQRQKKKQEENNRQLQEEQHRRVQEIAQMARRRQQEERELMVRKEKLLQDRYQMERERQAQEQQMKKKQNKEKESKKMDQFNQFARKQWYENQMIRKRAEERARQSQMEAFSEPSQIVEEPKLAENRPQSSNNSRNNSREKKGSNEPQKKYSMPSYEPSEQQLQNAMLNPNFNKKTPASVKSKQTTNSSSWTVNNEDAKKSQIPKKKMEQKPEEHRQKKNYDDARQQIKKDRQQFLKNKGGKSHVVQDKLAVQQALKPGKWRKKSRENSRQSPREEQESPKIKKEVVAEASQSIMDSKQLKLNIKDEEQFKDYLNELQDLLNNVNKNIENIQKPQPFPEMDEVEEQILVREDDAEEFDYSITASFDAIKPPSQEVNAENADFDYFSSYSKLQELRICLQDKFGTQNFIRIYRTLEDELQNKGLENFNILDILKGLGDVANSQLIADNLPLLLTLIVMEQRMSSV